MTISNERRIELLRMAAKYFKNCSDPFGTEVLREHEVTAEECAQLSVDIGMACDTDADILELSLSDSGRFSIKTNEIEDVYDVK